MTQDEQPKRQTDARTKEAQTEHPQFNSQPFCYLGCRWIQSHAVAMAA